MSHRSSKIIIRPDCTWRPACEFRQASFTSPNCKRVGFGAFSHSDWQRNDFERRRIDFSGFWRDDFYDRHANSGRQRDLFLQVPIVKGLALEPFHPRIGREMTLKGRELTFRIMTRRFPCQIPHGIWRRDVPKRQCQNPNVIIGPLRMVKRHNPGQNVIIPVSYTHLRAHET